MIIKESLKFFKKFEDFLSNPINKEYLEMYEATVFELNSKIIAKRDEYEKFDHIFNELYDFILKKNKGLAKHRSLIMRFMHFMYFNCDLGVKADVKAK